MKIIINECAGGFNFSPLVTEELIKRFGDEDWENMLDAAWIISSPMRTDPKVISVVEDLDWHGASGENSYLVVVEIPDDITDWTIMNDGGYEMVIYVQNGKIYYR